LALIRILPSKSYGATEKLLNSWWQQSLFTVY